MLLKRSLVFPILLFSCLSLHCSLKKAFISLIAILGNSSFRWLCLYFSPLPFTSLLFSAVCKASSGKQLALLHLFFLMVLVTDSCTVLRTSIHSPSGTLCIRSNPLNLFVHLYNLKNSFEYIPRYKTVGSNDSSVFSLLGPSIVFSTVTTPFCILGRSVLMSCYPLSSQHLLLLFLFCFLIIAI